MSTQATSIDLTAVKAAFIAAATGYIAARVTLMVAVKNALEAGATPENLRKWSIEAGYTRNGVNKALRAAGHSERGTRSDKGIRKFWEDTVTPAFIEANKHGKKAAATDAGKDDGDDDDGEDSSEGAKKDVKKTDEEKVKLIAAYALNLNGGDAAKASELGEVAMALIRTTAAKK